MSKDNEKVLAFSGPSIVASIAELRSCIKAVRRRQPEARIGLVPTMGCFHEGHLSLMRRARSECDLVVVSIFVNPRQFGPNEDFAAYPRSEERDLDLARREAVDLVFLPAREEIYPEDFAVSIQPGRVADGLCGARRPGHFDGVATVVAKLFNLVAPDVAYFGQKDAQQVAVIRRLAADLNFDLEIEVCPTSREPDGLAMSSRNVYLRDEERRQAPILYEALSQAQAAVAAGERETTTIKQLMAEVIATQPLVQLEYAAVVDGASMEPLQRVKKGALLAIAARVGSARLIDNLVLQLEEE